MHEVHTLRRLVVPPPAGVRTVWMLGFQRRLVRRCEWDTLWPKPGPLPQMSHTLATGVSWCDCPSTAGSRRQPDQVTRRCTWRANRPRCHRCSVGSSAVLDVLDAVAVRRWCAAALDGLRRHQQEIDDLNVYPVPDSDTGTNLVLTLAAAHEAVAEHGDLRVMARGALLGAKGNSGTIVAQLLKGLADALPDAPRGRAFAAGLTEAARSAWRVVDKPVDGTVLSVADAAARAAQRSGSDELAEVVRAAASGAAEALARTPDQLAVLAEAGVVDAGGRGLCVLLNALVEVVTGVAPPPAPPRRLAAPRESGSGAYAYEVQYLLHAP